MGRLVTIVALLLASATAAFAEDAIDPTVWSKNQWRSDLFQPYSTHRRPTTLHVVFKKTVVITQDTVQAEPVPVRPKLMIIGGSAGDHGVLVQRPGHACDGVLILRWMGDHADSSCNRSQSRLIRNGR